jgi:hypothetical protein
MLKNKKRLRSQINEWFFEISLKVGISIVNIISDICVLKRPFIVSLF